MKQLAYATIIILRVHVKRSLSRYADPNEEILLSINVPRFLSWITQIDIWVFIHSACALAGTPKIKQEGGLLPFYNRLFTSLGVKEKN
jgi:hypothetical protein